MVKARSKQGVGQLPRVACKKMMYPTKERAAFSSVGREAHVQMPPLPCYEQKADI